MTTVDVHVTVNGEARTAAAEPRTLLSDFLRHALRLTGTHVACEQGVCGSCTVLVDGEPTRSCLVLAVQVSGCRVETVEALAPTGTLGPLQEAMRVEGGLQCGFCTPGLLMGLAHADRNDYTVDETLDEVVGAHLCRCTGYAGIRAAVRRHWQQREAAR